MALAILVFVDSSLDVLYSITALTTPPDNVISPSGFLSESFFDCLFIIFAFLS